MRELPTECIGHAHAEAVSWEILSDLVDIGNRMAGHEGEQAAMERIERAFREHGLRDVSIDRFEIPAWFRGESSLELVGHDRRYDSRHELLALPGTPAVEATADLVDVGYGTPAEFDEESVAGKLVVASSGTPAAYDRWFHRREKYDEAVDRGAVGFLFRSHMEGCLPPTGDIGDEEGEGAIPGVGVSRELGNRLVRYCENSDVEARLSVDCRTETASSGTVSGVLGPETEQEILVTAHHDAHDIAEGAKDNGCGCALVVELARLLAGIEDQLETRVRFVTFGAEEIGLRGSTRMANQCNLSGITGIINLDGIGDSRELAVDTHGFEQLGRLFDAVSEQVDVPIEIKDQMNTHSDHWSFVRQGVPGVIAYSIGGSDERGWGHTHADTLDKLDKRDLQALAVPLAEAAVTLARPEWKPDHVDSEIVIERARAEGYSVEDVTE